jgi:hypothetical protein
MAAIREVFEDWIMYLCDAGHVLEAEGGQFQHVLEITVSIFLQYSYKL